MWCRHLILVFGSFGAWYTLVDWLLENGPSDILLQSLSTREHRYSHLSALPIEKHQPNWMLICHLLIVAQNGDMSRILLIGITILLHGTESVWVVYISVPDMSKPTIP